MNVFDVTFKSGSTIYISGPSKSGKSTLVTKIVRDRDIMFSDPISDVFWYSAFEPENKITGVTYIQGIPLDISERITPHCLVIIDDYMHELNENKELTNLITKAVHHIPMNLIYITQNLFQSGSQAKTRRINAAYLIMFKNPQDTAQVEYIGRQMYPNDKFFLVKAFHNATRQFPYTYLLIDSHATTSDYIRIRSNITRSDWPMTVYIPASFNIVDDRL